MDIGVTLVSYCYGLGWGVRTSYIGKGATWLLFGGVQPGIFDSYIVEFKDCSAL